MEGGTRFEFGGLARHKYQNIDRNGNCTVSEVDPHVLEIVILSPPMKIA